MTRRLWLPLLLVGVAGCGSPFAMSAPGARIVPARLVGVPARVDSFEINADNKVRPLPNEEDLVQENVDVSLNYGLSVRGGRFFKDEALAGLVGAHAFGEWSEDAMLEIGNELLRAAHGRSTHAGVSEWRYEGDLAPWREALRADFVIVSLFLDGENSAGRGALNVLASGIGGTSVSGKREATACVVALEDGRMIRCARVITEGFSVRDRKGAQKAVDQLLRELYADKGP